MPENAQQNELHFAVFGLSPLCNISFDFVPMYLFQEENRIDEMTRNFQVRPVLFQERDDWAKGRCLSLQQLFVTALKTDLWVKRTQLAQPIFLT